jgi:hypothetical protein
MVEMTCNTQRVILANNPSQDEEPCTSITSLARVTADWRAAVAPAFIFDTVVAKAELDMLAPGESMVEAQIQSRRVHILRPKGS